MFTDAEDYNVEIHVGQHDHIKVFKAHTNLLRARSPYFRTALKNDWAIKESGIFLFRKPNISPVVFEIILKYIYSGDIELEDRDPNDILALLVAADELILEELVEYAQHHLINNESQWLSKNFVRVMHEVFRLQACKTFQDHCIDAICCDPQSFFDSDEYIHVEKDILLALLRRNDLEMEEVDLWKHVVRWAVAQTQDLENMSSQWNEDDFSKLHDTLEDFIPLIRFFEITLADFYDHVRPFKLLLPNKLYEDLVRSHYKPQLPKECFILAPRLPRVDSYIIQSKHITLLSYWIEGGSGKPSTYHKPLYQFRLLYRGTRDNFTPRAFRNTCSNQGPTVVIIKIQGSSKIIGGYNPIGWCNRADYADTKESFIFAIDEVPNNSNNQTTVAVDKPKLSRVLFNMSSSAIFDLESYGPNFGKGDLVIYENCKTGSCRKYSYEHEIIDPGDFVADENVFNEDQAFWNTNITRTVWKLIEHKDLPYHS
ncbi:hypothetical protein G9A89_004404 [Geosiphon pyriformis]|nr:hypothetical protein G9A89_004404 [Geosiphon pyriformis]